LGARKSIVGLSDDERSGSSWTWRETTDGVVESAARIEAICRGVLKPLDEPVDDAGCAEGWMPLAVGVEVDAEYAPDKNVGMAEKPIVGDEYRRRPVGIVGLEPQLNVLMVSPNQQTAPGPRELAGVDTDSSMELTLADMKVRHAHQKRVLVSKFDELGFSLPLPGRPLPGSHCLGVGAALSAALSGLAGHAGSSAAATRRDRGEAGGADSGAAGTSGACAPA